jgi:hypothetical protein
MPDETPELRPSDLPLVLYLNQRVTFDILAALEDGFTQLATVETSNTQAANRATERELSLGLSNVFAFLGVGLRGGASGSDQNSSESKSTEELVYTPASLFARLRAELIRRGLVRTLTSENNGLPDMRVGEFVEFRATLRRPPLVNLLRSFKEIMPLVGELQAQSGTQGRNRGGQKPNSNKSIVEQIDTILRAVTSAGAEDLIAQTPVATVVLTAESSYFVDPTMNDVIDGDFVVFGKTTRVLQDSSSGSINLLRRSPVGKFGAVTSALASSSSQIAELEELGFASDSMEPEIYGPALQVIPIAIFA